MINGANFNGQIKCSVLMLSYFMFFYESHHSLNVLAAFYSTSVCDGAADNPVRSST